jgi:hypothetical protein
MSNETQSSLEHSIWEIVNGMPPENGHVCKEVLTSITSPADIKVSLENVIGKKVDIDYAYRVRYGMMRYVCCKGLWTYISDLPPALQVAACYIIRQITLSRNSEIKAGPFHTPVAKSLLDGTPRMCLTLYGLNGTPLSIQMYMRLTNAINTCLDRLFGGGQKECKFLIFPLYRLNVAYSVNSDNNLTQESLIFANDEVEAISTEIDFASISRYNKEAKRFMREHKLSNDSMLLLSHENVVNQVIYELAAKKQTTGVFHTRMVSYVDRNENAPAPAHYRLGLGSDHPKNFFTQQMLVNKINSIISLLSGKFPHLKTCTFEAWTEAEWETIFNRESELSKLQEAFMFENKEQKRGETPVFTPADDLVRAGASVDSARVSVFKRSLHPHEEAYIEDRMFMDTHNLHSVCNGFPNYLQNVIMRVLQSVYMNPKDDGLFHKRHTKKTVNLVTNKGSSTTGYILTVYGMRGFSFDAHLIDRMVIAIDSGLNKLNKYRSESLDGFFRAYQMDMDFEQAYSNTLPGFRVIQEDAMRLTEVTPDGLVLSENLPSTRERHEIAVRLGVHQERTGQKVKNNFQYRKAMLTAMEANEYIHKHDLAVIIGEFPIYIQNILAYTLYDMNKEPAASSTFMYERLGPAMYPNQSPGELVYSFKCHGMNGFDFTPNMERGIKRALDICLEKLHTTPVYFVHLEGFLTGREYEMTPPDVRELQEFIMRMNPENGFMPDLVLPSSHSAFMIEHEISYQKYHNPVGPLAPQKQPRGMSSPIVQIDEAWKLPPKESIITKMEMSMQSNNQFGKNPVTTSYNRLGVPIPTVILLTSPDNRFSYFIDLLSGSIDVQMLGASLPTTIQLINNEEDEPGCIYEISHVEPDFSLLGIRNRSKETERMYRTDPLTGMLTEVAISYHWPPVVGDKRIPYYSAILGQEGGIAWVCPLTTRSRKNADFQHDGDLRAVMAAKDFGRLPIREDLLALYETALEPESLAHWLSQYFGKKVDYPQLPGESDLKYRCRRESIARMLSNNLVSKQDAFDMGMDGPASYNLMHTHGVRLVGEDSMTFLNRCKEIVDRNNTYIFQPSSEHSKAYFLQATPQQAEIHVPEKEATKISHLGVAPTVTVNGPNHIWNAHLQDKK